MKNSKYKRFIFKDYRFDPIKKELTCVYGMDDKLEFKEIFRFDFEFASFSPLALDRASQNLFFMAGISYYKMYIPPEIIVQKGSLDLSTSEFLNKTYQKGLGEFWYVNKLDPQSKIIFPVNATISQNITDHSDGILIGVGGGKDSLVSIEVLREANLDISTWSMNHKSQLSPLIEKIGLNHLWVERTLDKKTTELNQQDALNGHIPISAILACVGTMVAILSGKRDVVVSNEQSANEPTLVYRGIEINHQYSKTQEFEKDYQSLLLNHFADTQRYYSLLRPFSELRIAELFSKNGFEKYKHLFSSCNRAYTLGSHKLSWCGECPKCAFVFLALTPFVDQKQLEGLWGGKNLLIDHSLEPTYFQLLGLADDKPLECVGEIRESRQAMTMAKNLYPNELNKYIFDMPIGDRYNKIYPDCMPEPISKIVIDQIQEQ